MSTIPLLAGLSTLTLASSLTALAITEAQFQHSAVQTVAESVALAVADDSLASATSAGNAAQAGFGQRTLTAAAEHWLPLLDERRRPKVSMLAYSPDGATIRVELCEIYDSWQLPWLSGVLGGPRVCAAANVRAVG